MGSQRGCGVQATLGPRLAVDVLVYGNFERFLWYLEYESSSNAAPDSARRTSVGATIDGWTESVKTNGRIGALQAVEVLDLAIELGRPLPRRYFLAECISDD